MRVTDSPLVENVFSSPMEKTMNTPPRSFSETLNNILDQTEQTQKSADALTRNLVVGDVENLHQVMAASEQAKLMLEFTVQIRNKIIDAYQEIIRMQV